MAELTEQRTCATGTDRPLQTQPPPPSSVPPHVWVWRRVKRYAPGLLALAVVGYAALLSSSYLTGLQYVPVAILLGAFVSNTFGVHPSLEKGISTYELWLKTGIVLLGSQVALDSLGVFWLKALPLAAATVLFGVFVVLAISRCLSLPPNLAALLAAGTGICGVSAVLHTADELGAEEEEIEYAVGAVLVLGAAAILLYPLVGRVLGLPEHVYGLWTGLSVNNTAESVATGYTYQTGIVAGSIAIAAKLCRVVMLGPVVALFAARERRSDRDRRPVQRRHLWDRLPKFVFGFFAFSLLAGGGLISDGERESLRNLSSWLFLIAFAGIGFKLRWSDIRGVGPRPLLAIGLGSLALALVTLAASMLLAGMMF
ncbi:MAG: YeiH family protein [Chloroflexota bacterium]|nr:YeiH family protein [Chloroflexota bacterium]